MEYVSGLVVSILILMMGVELFKTSVEKVIHPEVITEQWISYVILVISIALKFWMYMFNKGIGWRIHSETMKATAADSLNDNAYKDIEGATQSTFEPPTKVGGKRSYRCVVTENGNVKRKSEPAEVKVNLGKVNDPEIVIQPGTYSNLDVLSDTSAYQREYIGTNHTASSDCGGQHRSYGLCKQKRRCNNRVCMV